jgi:hypothetical protein
MLFLALPQGSHLLHQIKQGWYNNDSGYVFEKAVLRISIRDFLKPGTSIVDPNPKESQSFGLIGKKSSDSDPDTL